MLNLLKQNQDLIPSKYLDFAFNTDQELEKASNYLNFWNFDTISAYVEKKDINLRSN
jgi:hypothetical protein